MRLFNINGREQKKNVSKYVINWNKKSRSKIQFAVKKFLEPFWNSQIVYDTFVGQGAQNISLTLYPASFGGHSEVAGIALSAGLEAIFDYQVISTKGDLNGDQLLTLDDLDLLLSGLLGEINLTLFQQWGSDIDFTNSISVLDLILLSDSIQ